MILKKHLMPIRSEKGIKLKKTYWSSCKSCGGFAAPLDENGKKIPIVGNGGQHLYVGIRPQFEEVYFKFACVQASHKSGHVSKFNVYDDTPEEIVEALEDLLSDDSVDVWTEDDLVKRSDPKRYKEIKKSRILEEKLKLAKSERDSALQQVQNVSDQKDDIIKTLQAKLAKAEQKGKSGK